MHTQQKSTTGTIARITPTLTIAVPTYNRPGKLKDLLDSILGQCHHSLPIELLISDNSTGLETENLVAEYREYLPITYIHQPTNIGAIRNIMFAVASAQGCYCWIVGDDDLITHGSIVQLTSIIKENPSIPAIVCGYSPIPENDRPLFNNKSTNDELIQKASIFEDMTICETIDRWENIFFLSDVPFLYGALLTCAFRKDLWLKNSFIITNSLTKNPTHHDDDLDILNLTFPHTVIWGKMLIGKRVFVASKPMACLFYGEQYWEFSKIAILIYTHGLSLGRFYASQGGDKRAISRYKNIILGHKLLHSLLTSRHPYDMERFSMVDLLCENLDSRALWNNLFSYFSSKQIPWQSKLLTFSSVLYPANFIRLAFAPLKLVRSRVQTVTPDV